MTAAATHPHFTALYSDHHTWLHRWLCVKLGNAGDAADLAQDTFTRILGRADLAGLNQPRAFLTTVAKGVLVNWYQRQALERAYLEALAQQDQAVAASPEERALVIEALMQVDAMLNQLSPKAREAFLLSQLDGLTYEQIATELRVTKRTVGNYMCKAIEHCLLLAP